MIKYFWNPKFESIISKVPNKFLSQIAVKLYLGSPPTFPKDPDLAFQILDSSLNSSQHVSDRLDLMFSKYYLLRVKGIELKDYKLMEESNNGLKLLCRDQHPASLYVLGKELIMLKENMNDLTGRRALEQARNFLELSCKQGFAPAFYYLALAYEKGLGGPADMIKAMELYEKAKELGDPQGFFKLSQMEKEKGNDENSIKLMREAAEIGLLEAQHNLAVMYLEKNEEVKAMAWFLQAAKYYFFPSMVNVGMIFLRGNKTVLANPMAAFVWLSQAQGIQDSEEIQKLLVEAKDLIDKISKNGR